MSFSYYTTKKDRNAIRKIYNQYKWMDRSLHFQNFSHATVLPPIDWQNMGGLFDSEGKSVPYASWRDLSCESKVLVNSEEIHCRIIFIGNLLGIWGHLFTDNLARVWFLLTDRGKQLLEEGWKVAYTSIDEVLPDKAFVILRLLGVDIDNLIRVKFASKFDEVIVPEICFGNTDGNILLCTREYAELINIIRDAALKESEGPYPERIYYSRSGWDSKRDCGEEWRIENIFAKKGYVIVKPQELSVIQQIAILSNAKEFATTEGSLCHNSVFCNENVKLVILRKCDLVYYYQGWINYSANIHNVVWIKVHHSIRNNKEYPWVGPFYICPTIWLFLYSKDIRSIFIPIFHKSFWQYTHWISRGINKMFRILGIHKEI